MPHADETGGLSGAPVLQMSNQVIRQLRACLGKSFPIIGVGGVLSAADAVSKIQAGADLVQIYTGLIYKGPALVWESARALQAARRLIRSTPTTRSAMARELVRPGDSMPNRFTRPGTPCSAGP